MDAFENIYGENEAWDCEKLRSTDCKYDITKYSDAQLDAFTDFEVEIAAVSSHLVLTVQLHRQLELKKCRPLPPL